MSTDFLRTFPAFFSATIVGDSSLRPLTVRTWGREYDLDLAMDLICADFELALEIFFLLALDYTECDVNTSPSDNNKPVLAAFPLTFPSPTLTPPPASPGPIPLPSLIDLP